MNFCFIYPNPDLILLLGLLLCLFLLMAAAAYFAVEAIRNHSRIIHAYWAGKSEGLEQVIQMLKEKTTSEKVASAKEEPKEEKPFEPVNGC